jgi:hypothetical protein
VQGSGGSRLQDTASPARTVAEGLAAGAPLTETSPARMLAATLARLASGRRADTKASRRALGCVRGGATARGGGRRGVLRGRGGVSQGAAARFAGSRRGARGPGGGGGGAAHLAAQLLVRHPELKALLGRLLLLLLRAVVGSQRGCAIGGGRRWLAADQTAGARRCARPRHGHIGTSERRTCAGAAAGDDGAACARAAAAAARGRASAASAAAVAPPAGRGSRTGARQTTLRHTKRPAAYVRELLSPE